MDLALIISLFIMYFITKYYNQDFHFKHFKVEIVVNVLHIIVILLILYQLLTHQYLTMRLFAFWGIYVLIQNIIFLFIILNSYSLVDENDEDSEDNDDNENKEER